MKTKEELNALKNEIEALNAKLSELTVEELAQVSGGVGGVCGEYDGIIINNAEITNNSMPGSGSYSPGTYYGGTCGSHDQIVPDHICPEK